MLWGRPSLFLPSLARAPPGLSSHGAGPRFLGQGRRRSMKHCVYKGAGRGGSNSGPGPPVLGLRGLNLRAARAGGGVASWGQPWETWPSPCLGDGVSVGLRWGGSFGS